MEFVNSMSVDVPTNILREAFILCVNRVIGFGKKKPYASVAVPSAVVRVPNQ